MSPNYKGKRNEADDTGSAQTRQGSYSHFLSGVANIKSSSSLKEFNELISDLTAVIDVDHLGRIRQVIGLEPYDDESDTVSQRLELLVLDMKDELKIRYQRALSLDTELEVKMIREACGYTVRDLKHLQHRLAHIFLEMNLILEIKHGLVYRAAWALFVDTREADESAAYRVRETEANVRFFNSLLGKVIRRR